MYGGREDVHYFDDLWQLDIGSGAWQRIEPADGFRPAGRDHHAAAVHAGRLFVFAGRSGWDYCSSRPINSLWAFDLGARTWQRVPQTGDRRGVPLPRFEHSYAQAARPGSNGVGLVGLGAALGWGTGRGVGKLAAVPSPCQAALH